MQNTNSGKNDDQDEARVGDDFVVGHAVEAAAVVGGLRGPREHEWDQQGPHEQGGLQVAHHGGS